MIQIDALPAFSDNYIWLLQDPERRQCVVVDPGDAAPVIAWLQAHPGWRLSDILITHHHHDHVGGVLALKQHTGACVWGPADEQIPGRDQALQDQQTLQVLGLAWRVIKVPGHTLGHIAFYHEAEQPLLFSGDTLFAGGCGRLFEGTAEQMHASLQRLGQLPDSSLVYCAHEYTLSNMKFAAAVEPGNPEVARRLAEVSHLRERGLITVPSTLALEKQTNPFLRTHIEAVVKKADERGGHSDNSPAAVFTQLRAWKDKF